MFEMIEGRNNGYPVIKVVRDDIDTGLKAPLPLCMMICFGKNVNGGLPWIKRLRAVRKITDSSLYFKDKKAESLYFDNKDIETAYCNNKKVFDKYYVREYIV